jgi:hypothetical protein
VFRKADERLQWSLSNREGHESCAWMARMAE